MYLGAERRKFKRIRKPFIVQFHIRPHVTDKRSSKNWDMVAVLDLGAGGALFYYNKKIEVDSTLDMKVNVSLYKDPVVCTGKVIRVIELGYSYMFLVAVVFSDIDKKESEMINRIAEEFHSKKQAEKDS